MNKYSNIYKYLMGILLLVYISTIITLNIIIPDKTFSDSENRILEQRPKVSVKHVLDGKFTSNYEKYISDQFPLRDFWIGIKSSAEKFIGKKENNDVYLGKDGFLIQKFDKPKKEDINEKIEAINSFVNSNNNVNTYFMLIPNSIKILENKLPSFVFPEDQFIYMEKMKSQLNKNIKFVDVSNILSSKNNEYIYYKTDHHWTTKGAYYAYKELGNYMNYVPYDKDRFNIKKVTDAFYGSLYSKSGFRNIVPDSIELYIPKKETKCNLWYSDSNKTYLSPYHMNNLNKKDKYTVFFDSNHPLVKICSNVDNNKKLLVIKDSYANCLVPFLINHYNEIYMVDLRYYKENLTKLISSKNINEVLFLYNVNTFFEDTSINNL